MSVWDGGSVCVVSVCGDYIHGFRIDDLGWEGYNNIKDSHQCPHPPYEPPASRIHCCHMMQTIVLIPRPWLNPRRTVC